METQNRTSPHPLMIIAAIAVTVFSAAGIAAIMGWIPTSSGDAAPPLAATASVNGAKPLAQAGATRQQTVTVRTPRTLTPLVESRVRCADCGVIESVREIEKAGDGTGLGAVGGAVAGGVLGNQVGAGRGKDVMTVVGAVAGGIAGNQIEKKVRSTKSYEISVRMEDGSTRLVSEPNAPAWHSGDRVRLIEGRIQPDKA